MATSWRANASARALSIASCFICCIDLLFWLLCDVKVAASSRPPAGRPSSEARTLLVTSSHTFSNSAWILSMMDSKSLDVLVRVFP